MKKLMIVAAAAFGMAAFGDIESSNIVGYAGAPDTVDQYNFFSFGFNTVGCNTVDIQQLIIDDGGAGSIGWGTEVFSIWAGGPDVVEGSEFVYFDPSMDLSGTETTYYWGDAAGTKADFSIEAGQGVVVQCAEGLKVTFAGEVPTEGASFTTVDGYNFIGNPFPTELDIQNIKMNGEGIGWGTEVFSIWASGPDVIEGSEFVYYDPSMDVTGTETTYYWGDAAGNKVSYPIAIGQGAVIQCGADIEVSITVPYGK